MKLHRFNSTLGMIELDPPIPGWQEFISVYVIKGRDVAIVEVGPQCSGDQVIEGLRRMGIDIANVRHVLLSHIHIDHAGGIGEVLDGLPNADAVVHPKGSRHLADVEKLWQGSLEANGDLARAQGKPKNVPAERVVSAKDGQAIDLGAGVKIEVIHTPGHAAHHMSFLETGSGALFAGEAIGVYSRDLDLLRPATAPPARVEHTVASMDKLLGYDAKSVYYSHFGYGGEDVRGLINRAKSQLSLWQEVIWEDIQRKSPADAIFEELLRKDPDMRNLEKLPRDQYLRELHFIGKSIKGLVDCLTGA